MLRSYIVTVVVPISIAGAVGSTAAQQTALAVTTTTSSSVAVSQLTEEWTEIALAAQGKVGVACQLLGSTHESDSAILNYTDRFPMQSVYKLPIAMAILQQVDEGRLNLEQKIRVEPSDFVGSRQHSPIRDKNPQGTEMTLRDLIRYNVAESDGSACDVLLRVGGGPTQVMQYLANIGVSDVVVLNTEKEIGSDNSVQFANYATPAGMVQLLAKLQNGSVLTSNSRAVLMKYMVETPTGPNRLKGLLPKGTVVAHKTGTSRAVDGITAATNDVGIIHLPDGRFLAIAIFITDARANNETRDRVIAEIALAAYNAHLDL